MYVCLCHAISDRQIREAVEHGAQSLDKVQCQLPVGTCCGSCADTARQIIESHARACAAPAAA